jgi:hypothetical protein
LSKIEEDDDDDDKTTIKSISKGHLKTTITTTKVIALWKKRKILYGSENIIKSTIEDFHLITENIINCTIQLALLYIL